MTAHPGAQEAARTMTTSNREPRYEIVVRGEIGDHFGLVFERMRLERVDGTTVLTGPVLDQAQLHGLIERIGELGLELISVNALLPPLLRGRTDDDRP